MLSSKKSGFPNKITVNFKNSYMRETPAYNPSKTQNSKTLKPVTIRQTGIYQYFFSNLQADSPFETHRLSDLRKLFYFF
jgi:hypothetical protein